MILVDWQIRQAIESGEIKVDPFDESLINPASLDIRLGSFVKEVRGIKGEKLIIIDPLNKSTIIESICELPYYLKPGCAVIAPMLERVDIAPNIVAKVYGKSSLGRVNLDNSSCAGFVDPGWEGILTMELFNHSSNTTIKLTEGMKIGQIVFERVLAPARSYNVTGRYQNQDPGQGSLGV